jgi:hypothetical protein
MLADLLFSLFGVIILVVMWSFARRRADQRHRRLRRNPVQ